MVFQRPKNLMWPFLHRNLMRKTYGDKLYVEKETENGYVIAIKAINQKNCLMLEQLEKEKALQLFIDYDLHKGRRKPKTTEEFTKSRLTFFNSIIKCRCLPDGKFVNMTNKEFLEYGVRRKQHYRYFLFSCLKKSKPIWPIGCGDGDKLGISESAPISTAKDDEGGNQFVLTLEEAKTLANQYIDEAVAKKRAGSMDCLAQICEDSGIVDTLLQIENEYADPKNEASENILSHVGSYETVTTSNLLQDWENSPQVGFEGFLSKYDKASYTCQPCSNEIEVNAKSAFNHPLALNHAEQGSPVNNISVADAITPEIGYGQLGNGYVKSLSLIDPNIFLNLEEKEEKKGPDFYGNFEKESSRLLDYAKVLSDFEIDLKLDSIPYDDLSLEDMDIDIPRNDLIDGKAP